jgi:DegV family protein with EDD domain
MSIGIVVDSAGNLPLDLVERHAITVVPMYLKFGDRVYRDGVDLPPAGFYDLLTTQTVDVSTSGPSVGDFREIFGKALAQHAGIVCVTVAGHVSVTYSSAALAAADFDGRVRVVDSRSASMAEGFVALEAARASEAGAGLDEVEARALDVADRGALAATIDTFEFLRRSGRVNALKAFAATTLNVKPVFALRRGSVEQLARPRARSRAIERVMEEARIGAATGPLHLAVVHAACPDEARSLAERCESDLDPAEMYVTEFTPLMGAHTGPGLLGIAFWS